MARLGEVVDPGLVANGPRHGRDGNAHSILLSSSPSSSREGGTTPRSIDRDKVKELE